MQQSLSVTISVSGGGMQQSLSVTISVSGGRDAAKLVRNNKQHTPYSRNVTFFSPIKQTSFVALRSCSLR